MNWKAKLKPFFGVLLLLTVAFLPVIVCSLSLLGYHDIKKVGDPLFVSLFPFHYTYLLFPASNSLFFWGLLVFLVLGVCLLWPLGDRSRLMKFSAYGLIGLVVLQSLGAGGFYGVYNYTGNRAWNNYRESELAKPDSYYREWRDVLVNKEIPDKENFAMTPLFAPFNRIKSALNEDGDEGSMTQESEEISSSANAKLIRSFPRYFPGPPQEDRKPGVVYIFEDKSDLDKRFLGNWREGEVFSVSKLYLAMPSLVPHEPNLPLAAKAQAILKEFAKYDAGFNEIEKAAQRPHFWFHLEYERGIFALLPHLGKMRSVARSFDFRASARLTAGDTQGALQDIKTILSMSKGLSQEPALISHLVARVLSSFAIGTLFEGLAMRGWNEEQLTEAELVLSGFDWLAVCEMAWVGEMAFMNHAFDRILNGNALEKKAFINLWMPGPLEPVFYIPGWVRRNQLNYNRAFIDLDPLLVNVKSRRVHAGKFVEDPLPELGFHYFINRLQNDPRSSGVPRNFARAQTDFDLARVAIALERYRLKEKNYPDSLEALVPTYLKPVPHDIMDGKPLRYVRKQDDYQLYSVG